jgi:cold shock CspA family protein
MTIGRRRRVSIAMTDTGQYRLRQEGWVVMQGTIQSLRMERGFGFLRDGKGGDVFVHHTALPSPKHVAALTIGMTVEFEAEPGPKGPRATKVMRVPEPR